MARKKDLYMECCIEIVRICELAPGWSLADFLKEEDLDVTRGLHLFSMLKQYREQLELVSTIIAGDEETEKIMADGLKIYSLIMKEQMYGSEED